MKDCSFVSGKDTKGAQKPKNLAGKPKEAKLPEKTTPSMNMGKKNPPKTSGGSKGTMGGGAGGY